MSDLDQFFTKPHIALLCWESLSPIVTRITGRRIEELFFVEPAVGDGAFYDLLPPMNRMGIDIDPRRREFLGQDFLKWNSPPLLYPKPETVVVGNPPFGKRATKAIQFFLKSAFIADTVAFIVPVIFRKYSVQKQLPPGWRLIYTMDLPRESFWTDRQPVYELNTEFHVWTTLPSRDKNHRVFEPPPLSHPDFQFWQYNNTRGALKVFNEPFDFAVPCQGWQDYRRREQDPNLCEKHKQWMLFKPQNELSRARLYEEIDYERLAFKSATAIPGFRKGDLVQEYIKQYGAVA